MDCLLLESGDRLLLESGTTDCLLLESTASAESFVSPIQAIDFGEIHGSPMAGLHPIEAGIAL